MRRKSNGQHEPNLFERLHAQRAERLGWMKEASSGRISWAEFDRRMLERNPKYQVPVRDVNGHIVG